MVRLHRQLDGLTKMEASSLPQRGSGVCNPLRSPFLRGLASEIIIPRALPLLSAENDHHCAKCGAMKGALPKHSCEDRSQILVLLRAFSMQRPQDTPLRRSSNRCGVSCGRERYAVRRSVAVRVIEGLLVRQRICQKREVGIIPYRKPSRQLVNPNTRNFLGCDRVLPALGYIQIEHRTFRRSFPFAYRTRGSNCGFTNCDAAIHLTVQKFRC